MRYSCGGRFSKGIGKKKMAWSVEKEEKKSGKQRR